MNRKKITMTALVLALSICSTASMAADHHWGANGVNMMVQKGILGPGPVQNFDIAITRVQLAHALYQLAGSPEVAVTVSFQDVADTDADQKAIQWVAKNGIIIGDDGKFDPQSPVTREMLAEILYRFAGDQLKEEGVGMDIQRFQDYDQIAQWALGGVAYCFKTQLLIGDDESYFNPKAETSIAQIAAVLSRMQGRIQPEGIEARQTTLKPVDSQGDYVKIFSCIAVIKDASMNNLFVVTEEGKERSFIKENAQVITEDGQGLAVGDAVRIIFAASEDNNNAMVIEKLSADAVHLVEGTVKDVSMNTLIVTDETGADHLFVTTYAEVVTNGTGIMIGDEVVVKYAGNLERDTAAKVTKVINENNKAGGSEGEENK